MVSTRSKSTGASTSTVPSSGPAPDDNRIIAVVTGANSGIGLGLCHALLANLSVPSGSTIPAAVPQATALAPPLAGLLEAAGLKETNEASSSTGTMPKPHPTLTLVLACRSASNAAEAREDILSTHKRELESRRKKGESIPQGWEEGLRVEYELVDLDSVGGPKGLLSFADRLATRYPHITSLFLNAGYAAFKQVVIPRFIMQILTDGYIHALHHPRYNIEDIGLKSADGERGKVWGVNVLAPYILAKELAPLLRKSPASLPFQPRVVYTSSIEAEAESLSVNSKDDYQLLTYEGSYRASKYMGDLVITRLDAELGTGDRPIRCLIAEPGCVATNIAVAGLGAWAWLVSIKWVCYWLSFWFANLIGSPHHPVWATAAAVPMLYSAFIADKYLEPSVKLAGPKMRVVARRWKMPAVQYGEVDEWERNGDFAEFLVTQCEGIRQEWRRREGK